MKNQKKINEYTLKVTQALSQIFEDDSKFSIDKEEFNDDANATALIYVISSLAPAYIYTEITGDKVDILAFNHIANRLIFQFANNSES